MNRLQENWLQLHLAVAPFGTLAVTWLLWFSGGDGWQWWNHRGSMEQMGQMAPLGAAVYGSLILVIERVGRMFWLLAQREKDIEKGREEGRVEGREEGIEVGREEGIEVGRERLIRQLVEQNVPLPPEILAEVRDRPYEPPRN